MLDQYIDYVKRAGHQNLNYVNGAGYQYVDYMNGAGPIWRLREWCYSLLFKSCKRNIETIDHLVSGCPILS